MKQQRVSLGLAGAALLVALFGSTPLGSAAGRIVRAVPPFAKRADYATKAGFAKHAQLADLATNAKLVVGHRISASPKAGDIPVVGTDGKLPESIGAVGPPGQQGPKGDTGPGGATNIRMRSASTTDSAADVQVTASCDAGERVVGGGGVTGGSSFYMENSYPSLAGGANANGGSPTSWTVRVHRTGGGSLTVNAYVLCASP